jgi:hypothetical protein
MLDERLEFLKALETLRPNSLEEYHSLDDISIHMNGYRNKFKMQMTCNLLKDDQMLEQKYNGVQIRYRITHNGHRFLESPYRYENTVKNRLHGIVDESTRKWTKFGIISAIVISIIALIVSIVSP